MLYHVASRLHLVWISHPHADHHLGLVAVIRNRHSLLAARRTPVPPLLVIGPPAVLDYLQLYATLVDPGIRGMFVAMPCHLFEPGETGGGANSAMVSEKDRGTCLERLGLMRITELVNAPVVHCSQSYGVAISFDLSAPQASPSASTDSHDTKRTKLQTGGRFKVVYSGDTRPCQSLVDIGMRADILIHEATFDDTLPQEALNKRHSTISEALEVAFLMQAKSTILTHFSQRYPHIPPLPANPGYTAPLFAFDFMTVSTADLSWGARVTEALTRAFPAEEDVVDEDEVAMPGPSGAVCVSCSDCAGVMTCLGCRTVK